MDRLKKELIRSKRKKAVKDKQCRWYTDKERFIKRKRKREERKQHIETDEGS